MSHSAAAHEVVEDVLLSRQRTGGMPLLPELSAAPDVGDRIDAARIEEQPARRPRNAGVWLTPYPPYALSSVGGWSRA